MILLFILVSRKACFVLVLVLVVVDVNIVVHPGIQESLLCCCC